ncbi:MAG: oligopeptide/dipeptide ABC transporter ATP-binding protein [Streptosporangiaceae bacterium]
MTTATASDGQDEAILVVDRVSKQFGNAGRAGFSRRVVRAVTDVTFTVAPAEVVAIVGETGSGKTTLGNCVTGLIEATSGHVWFDGVDLAHSPRRLRAQARRKIQPVFQDPRSSLDPRWSAGRTIREALDSCGIGTAAERRERVRSLMDLVGLPRFVESRYPHQLSGGQQQRVAIAAALALQPALLVADEPVSALDVSVQAQILNLFETLRTELGLAILFISHDLSVVEHISDRVIVMYLGRVVESGTVAQVFDHPVHPYTQALLEAIPRADPKARHTPAPLRGEIPSTLASPAGCVFATRCPQVVSACRSAQPPETSFGPGHAAACLVAAQAVHG